MKYPILFTSLVLTGSVLTVPLVFSDEDRHEYRQRSVGVAEVTLPAYKEECGSCHMAYPPGLLPARSWQKVMSGLESHFGDNAELEPKTAKTITDFLTTNSADNSAYRRSQKIMRSTGNEEVPIRITETGYIKREHREIPDRMISKNEKVKSLANCNACHQGAEKGLFDEHGVKIPGYGRWED